MASPSRKYASNVVTATGAELLVETVGFVPDKIKVHNLTNNIMVEWMLGLAAGRNVKHAAAGDRSVLSSGGVEAYAGAAGHYPGIKIPILTDINDTTTEELLWEAWG